MDVSRLGIYFLTYDAVQFDVLTYFCEVAASPESNVGMPQFLLGFYPLKVKLMFYIVPRSKHFPPRLHKPVS